MSAINRKNDGKSLLSRRAGGKHVSNSHHLSHQPQKRLEIAPAIEGRQETAKVPFFAKLAACLSPYVNLFLGFALKLQHL
jgi:hypothetical protein